VRVVKAGTLLVDIDQIVSFDLSVDTQYYIVRFANLGTTTYNATPQIEALYNFYNAAKVKDLANEIAAIERQRQGDGF
jgi:hypothetical protein